MKKILIAICFICLTWFPCVLFKVPFDPYGYIWSAVYFCLLLALIYWPEKQKLIIPEEGRKVKITWLPSCINGRGTPNPYIGMEGIARDVKPDGYFHLESETCWLIVGNEYKFEYTDEQEK